MGMSVQHLERSIHIRWIFPKQPYFLSTFWIFLVQSSICWTYPCHLAIFQQWPWDNHPFIPIFNHMGMSEIGVYPTLFSDKPIFIYRLIGPYRLYHIGPYRTLWDFQLPLSLRITVCWPRRATGGPKSHRRGLGGAINGLVDGKIYRKTPYLMGKSMVSCKKSLKPIQSHYQNLELVMRPGTHSHLEIWLYHALSKFEESSCKPQ